jgi:hypothetical protein
LAGVFDAAAVTTGVTPEQLTMCDG